MSEDVETIDRGARQVARRSTVDAPPEEIFALLADPHRHGELDGSGTVGDAGALLMVTDAGALAALGDRVELKEIRAGELGEVGVVEALVDAMFPSDTAARWPQLPDETARQWLLPPVWERMVAGRGEFLADLRQVISADEAGNDDGQHRDHERDADRTLKLVP